MRTRTLALALTVVLALAAGCGTETVGPDVDTVAPAAVLDVTAAVTAGGIHVEWTPGSEADLAGYRVYRSINGNVASEVGWVTTSEFLDTNRGEGTVYVYEVAAVDASGNAGPRATSQVLLLDTNPGTTRDARVAD